MSRITSIVEGHGEVEALPLLLRRLWEWRSQTAPYPSIINTPIRVRRDRFLNKPEEFERFLLLANAKAQSDGWILILFDADDDCPAKLGLQILQRAREILPSTQISVVLANREYEAWFIASAKALDGQRGFALNDEPPPDPEGPRDAKGWIGRRMAGKKYSEVLDHPALTQQMDLSAAFAACRSFRKLCSEWDKRWHNS
jgi:hypothetical protein